MKRFFIPWCMAAMAAGCATNPSSKTPDHVIADHAVIVQNGVQLTPTSADGGMYRYAIANGPFSILVPSTDANGHAYPADATRVLLCAQSSPTRFDEVKVGVYAQDTYCLNSTRADFFTPEQTAKGMDLYVSNAITNTALGVAIKGPTYNTINIARVVDFKGTSRCFFHPQYHCGTFATARTGDKIYLTVFADANANLKVDQGEYTMIELDLGSPQ
jgi:hypothetical protein